VALTFSWIVRLVQSAERQFGFAPSFPVGIDQRAL
jgi:hypothetical protein